MQLHDLRPAPGAHTHGQRIGRGIGSGSGKTSGKGHKGQKARAGGSIRLGFEGGQVPLQRRLPKRGFRNPNKTVYEIINLSMLAEVPAGTVVDEAFMIARGMVRHIAAGVKVLGNGELTQILTVKASAFSAEAKRKIEAAGGTVEVV